MELVGRQTPIGDLREHPDNPRRGNVPRIAESLAWHGQYRPIVAQASTGYVLAGNHTLKAARSLGWETISAVYVDVDDEQARRILLVDNRSADMGTYDNDALLDLLAELNISPDGLSATGYEPVDLDDLLAADQERQQAAGPDQASRDYAQQAVRNMIMSYEGEQFRWVTDRLADARAELGADSNAAALVALLHERFPDEPLP